MSAATVSFWMDDARGLGLVPAAAPPLESSLAADALVVGGGFAGLSAAIALARAAPGRRVVLAEAQRIGFGATGRNAGMLSPVPAPTWLLDGALPRAEAAWATNELRRRAGDLVRELAPLDGGPRPATMYLCASSRFLAEGLRWLEGRLAARGLEARLLGGDEAGARTGERCRASLALPAAAVHPARFALSLRELALRAGVEIFERTRVERIEPGPRRVSVYTDAGGRIDARRVVLAAGAWSSLPPFGARGRVFQTYMLATPPLGDGQLAALGGEGTLVGGLGRGLSYRRLANGRLLFGGLDDAVRAPSPAGAIPHDVEPRLRAMLRAALPQLGEVEVDRVWGGPFHVTSASEMPALAAWPNEPRVVSYAGSAGAGVLWCLLAGPLLRGMVDPSLDEPDDRRLRAAMSATRVPALEAISVGAKCALRAMLPGAASLHPPCLLRPGSGGPAPPTEAIATPALTPRGGG